MGQSPLEHNRYLSKLMAWVYFNGLLTDQTCLHLAAQAPNIKRDTLHQFAVDIRNTFSLKRHKPSLEDLSNPCEIRKLALFVNVEEDPTSEFSSPEVFIENAKNKANIDIFNYGDDQQCLVESIDLIYINSWNEVRTLNFKGESTMLDVLKTLLNKMHKDAKPPESIDVFCYAKQMRGVIRNGVFNLVNKCIDMRLQQALQKKNSRFKAIRLANSTYGLFFERRGVSVKKLENPVEFYRAISKNKEKAAASLVEVNQGEKVRLPNIVDAYASEGLLQFFFEDCEQGFNIYVLDENNNIEAYPQCSGIKEDFVNVINRFYAASSESQIHRYGDQSVNFNLPQFYDIIYPEEDEAQAIPYKSERWQQRCIYDESVYAAETA